jgi:AcrR family transcriptional regulator
MAASTVVSNARARAHAAVRADITAEARRQLAVAGAASLSLRAVARELGMASSAMYRYFTSRDELLTALIVEGYDAMGEVAEAEATAGGTAARRFQAVCRAIRGWALDHPHEYALLYGAPVPGYHAPELTTSAAGRTIAVLASLVRDAHQAGELSPDKIPPLSKAMAAQARPIGQAIMPGVPLPVVARALAVWAQLFGQLNFEIFGRQQDIVPDSEVLFDFTIATMLDMLGITPGADQPGRVQASRRSSK